MDGRRRLRCRHAVSKEEEGIWLHTASRAPSSVWAGCAHAQGGGGKEARALCFPSYNVGTVLIKPQKRSPAGAPLTVGS